MQPQMGMMPPQMGQMPYMMQPQGYAKGGGVRHLGSSNDESSPVDDQMMAILHKSPQFTQAIDQADAEFADIPMEVINELIRMIRFMVKHPEKYAEIRSAVIKDGMLKAEQIPEKFDTNFLGTMLSVLVALKKKKEGKNQAQQAQGQFAKGGLAQAAQLLQRQGRGGDTILAHINPREAAMLRANGGAGTINPHTGLREYGNFFSDLWEGVKDVAKVVVPIVLTAFVPAAGAFLGSFMAGTIGATAAGILGTTIAGAASGALGAVIQGGDVGKGAIFGGITGGLTQGLGSLANSAAKGLGMTKGLSQAAQGYIGSTLAGAGAAAATGEDWKQGAIKGLAQRYISNKLQNFEPVKKGTEWLQGKTAEMNAPEGGFGKSMAKAPVWDANKGEWVEWKPNIPGMDNVTGPNGEVYDANGLTGRYAGTGNTTPPPGVGINQNMSPADLPTGPATGGPMSVANNLVSGAPAATAATAAGAAPGAPAAGAPADQGFLSKAWNAASGSLGTAGTMLALSALSGGGAPPPAAQEAISTLSPEQQKYFAQPLKKIDYSKMMQDASASGIPLATFMSQNMQSIREGAYDIPDTAAPAAPAAPTGKARGGMAYATGGALSKVAYLAEGSGSGRADTIDAKLSDGEYVIDAETVALLGDGSTKEGARRLDVMRQQLRRQKGKMLAKGKFSPAARSPLAYLAGAR
jgi:hypothetical protein